MATPTAGPALAGPRSLPEDPPLGSGPRPPPPQPVRVRGGPRAGRAPSRPSGGVGLRGRRLRRRARHDSQPRGLRPGGAQADRVQPGGRARPLHHILGRSARAPIVLAPTGYSRLGHHTGERAVAAAAAEAGLPYTLATYATTSITDVALAAPGGRNWFQLYLMKEREVSLAHLAEARARGYEAIVLTIDTTVTGLKRKDLRNGFAIPPRLTARTLAGWPCTRGGWRTSSPPNRCGSRPSPRVPLRPLGDVQPAARAGAPPG